MTATETAPRPDLSALFARAKDANLEAVAGVKLFAAGRRMRGECPVCGASKGKRADGAFWIDPQIGKWGCFSESHKGGDVIELERQLRGGSPREAAERLAGPAPALRSFTPPVRPKPAAPAPSHVSSPFVQRAWRCAMPAAGTLAARYLAARGIEGPVLAAALRHLRFEPSMAHSPGYKAPAMLGLVERPEGWTGGIHATFLALHGRAKASLSPAKKMFGPQNGADGIPGGLWLIKPEDTACDAHTPLIEGEGIESTLSAAVLFYRREGVIPCAVATLSLRALQGGWASDKFGRYSPDAPAADLERPAFTWPDQDEVLVAIDRDMKPVPVKVRGPDGKTLDRVLDAEARGAIAASLATQHWRKAGANRVRVIGPRPGRDFNDELKAVNGWGEAR